MLRVKTPGLQTTLQGAPRRGSRHLGFPYSGPADPLSMALANRLVGNDLQATCLEITYGGFEVVAEQACTIAVTGAFEHMDISGKSAPAHVTVQVKEGDTVSIAPPRSGARTYLAVRSGFSAAQQFGSASTYLPAGLGGHEGRALKVGDVVSPTGPAHSPISLETPSHACPAFTGGFALRACASAETSLLTSGARETLFSEEFTAGRQATRMGIALTGHELKASSDGMMKSAPVFPGAIQCPPSGMPIALLCDAQTTGGYPRIASIARCDRHLLGQIRPGDPVRLLERTPEEAVYDYKAKQALLREWLVGL